MQQDNAGATMWVEYLFCAEHCIRSGKRGGGEEGGVKFRFKTELCSGQKKNSLQRGANVVFTQRDMIMLKPYPKKRGMLAFVYPRQLQPHLRSKNAIGM